MDLLRLEAEGLYLRFTSPRTTYSANQLDEVVPLLKAAEAAAKTGAWVAVMLSYEAAPAFDEALKTHAPGSLPLAWAAVFDKPVTLGTAGDELNYRAGIHLGRLRFNSVGFQLFAIRIQQRRNRIRELITRGDTYQVNYTFPLRSHFNGDPNAWYQRLCAAQGADYCAYLDLGRYKVLSYLAGALLRAQW